MKSTDIKPVMVKNIFALFIAILSGCSNNSERILTQAPQNESELGFLVSGSTEIEKTTFIDKFLNVQIREISNDNIIMFEAVNTDYQTLRTHFPSARIYKNEFIKYADVLKPQLTMNEIRLMNTNLASTTPTFDLQSCKEDSLKPIAKMNFASANLFSRKTLDVGAQIQIDSKDSQPHAFVGGKLNVAWVVQAPSGSFVSELHFTNKLDINLDTMGMYQIYLVVQDQKKNCQFENANISVTGNTPYLGVSSSNLDFSIAQQIHVDKLGLKAAHKVTTGKGQIIAIVDSGVNYNNPYLSENIFTNPNEIPDNDLDDDKNGLIDDVHGWDFVYNDKYPYDDLGHGSHVAGLAAAKVFGVAPDAVILPIKAGSNSGTLDLGTTFKAIIYALKMDADIINLSLGGERPVFKEEIELYKLAMNKNTIIVAAAGNGEPSRSGIFLGFDIDNRSYSPAGIEVENILSVAAVSNNDELAYYSNFGKRKIRVATYGGEDFNVKTLKPYDGQLFSTYIENPKGEMFWGAQGTSMAAPVAAGVAALVRSLNPNLTPAETIKLLESAGTPDRALQNKIRSGRILRADEAVELTKTTTLVL